MKLPLQLHDVILFICMVFFATDVTAVAQPEQIASDPDRIATVFEYSSTLSLKTGDQAAFGPCLVGGFIETANEPQLGSGTLPNQRWRGFFSAQYTHPLIELMQQSYVLSVGIEHSSSYGSLRMQQPTSNTALLIYDGTIRNSILNAIPIGVKAYLFDQHNRLSLQGRYLFYVNSKNTPELSGVTRAAGHGFSAGFLYRYINHDHRSYFLSGNDRFIFKSHATAEEYLYTQHNNSIVPVITASPVIEQSHTFTLTTGVSTPLYRIRRSLSLYCRYLTGSGYGFIDSRVRESTVSVGIALHELQM